MAVDDNKKSLEILEAALVSCGYRVVLAGSGQEALDKARTDPPDLVLLDIMMPGLDGYRVAEELKREERTRNIPIIMLTALDDAYDRIKALQAGAEDFLTKPVHRKELAVRIRTLLKMKAYNDHLRNSRENLKNALTEKKAEIHEALESFSRFVPREFLQCLGKTNIIDVSLGDQKLLELTILFCDIRGFSSLSEKMTPQENFNQLRRGTIVTDFTGYDPCS
jgi:DNA-binding response OmpR family regulator